MKTVIIAGKQGSGKTTLQNLLATTAWQKFQKRSEKINFADVIYEIHNFAMNRLDHYGFKRDIVKDGRLLQLLGTEWGRQTLGNDIWVQIALNRIAEAEHKGVDLVLIGDCRFANELDAFKDLSGAVRVFLSCSREVRKDRCSQWRDDEFHPSETGLDGYEEQVKFDLVLDTAILSPERCLEKILGELKWT